MNIEKRKNIFINEVLYLFFDENIVKDFFINEKIYENIGFTSLIEFIYEFIKYLLDIYPNYFQKTIFVVIDNFDEDNEEEINILENIIMLIKKGDKYMDHLKIKLILSGRCKFMNRKQLFYLINSNNFNFKINNEMFLYYNKELNGNNDMNFLPLYHFRIKNEENDESINEEFINEEIKFCKKFNLYGMYYSFLHKNEKMKISDLEKYYAILPIDYLVFKKINLNIISFKFHNEIFESAIKKSIEIYINYDAYKYPINKSEFNNSLLFRRKTFDIIFFL